MCEPQLQQVRRLQHMPLLHHIVKGRADARINGSHPRTQRCARCVADNQRRDGLAAADADVGSGTDICSVALCAINRAIHAHHQARGEQRCGRIGGSVYGARQRAASARRPPEERDGCRIAIAAADQGGGVVGSGGGDGRHGLPFHGRVACAAECGRCGGL